ncbi:MAG: DUF2130 domain-containing protein [Erysipelotrichaceae bacterium]
MEIQELKGLLNSAKQEKEKQLEIEKANSKTLLEKNLSDFKAEIERLKAQISESESLKTIALKDEEQKKNKELFEKDALINKLNDRIEQMEKTFKTEKENELKLLEANTKAELERELSLLKNENEKLKSEKELVIVTETNKLNDLQNKLTILNNEKIIELREIEQKLEYELKKKDVEINYYKDLKTKSSTKMLGETLEKHCEVSFNQIRAVGFQNSYFEKDNDARTGSKGDYIFKEKTDSGVEFISIMFEMKNEADTTSSKKKNEDFLKELDKDRNEKGCEYAVLVSLLESDNELYNNGIVDMSYKYPKMYVIRPQFFIPIITLLRNAALNSIKYREQLIDLQRSELDITNFEQNMQNFKDNIGKNYDLASRKFKTAIEEIDKTISNLNKVKDNLLSSEKNLRFVNDKTYELSIKKLTKDSPSIAKKFEELKNK